MKRPGARSLLLVGLAWLAIVPLLPAQRSSVDDPARKREKSHAVLPNTNNRVDAERLLRERLDHARELHDWQEGNELLQKILQQPDKYLSKEDQDQLRKLRGDPYDLRSFNPDLYELVRKWVKEQKGRPEQEMKVPQRQLDSLERLLGEAPKVAPGIPPDEPPPPATTPSPSPPDRPRSPDRPPIPPGQHLPPAAQEAREVEFRQQLLRLLERLPSSVGGSDVLRRAQEDLYRSRFQQADDWLKLRQRAEGLRAELPRLSQSLGLDGILPDAGQLFRGRPTLPDLGGWSGSVSPPGLPAVSAPGDGSDLWHGLLWLVAGVALVLVLWKILAGQRGKGSEPGTGWRLGRWPVDPASVATREDLVRAFEYLTLLCFGPVARSWNHLQIAERLGGTEVDEERHRAAVHLAGLYEQARYAPPEGPLPAGELEAARRHLCFLAGASAE